MNQKNLLILDLDECLIHAAEKELDTACDFVMDQFFVYRRPHLDEFLEQMQSAYALAVWSSGTELYVMELLAHIAPDIKFEFVFDRNRCTRRFDPERKDYFFLKDLKKVKESGFDLDRVLILEDEPRKVSRHYGNLVYVRPFYGGRSDEELPPLAQYLLSIKDESNLRSIDKRLWRKGA